jgi:pyruvate kinase
MLLHRARPGLARALCSKAAPGPLLRLTKIVATIGPASEQAEPLQACVDAGIDVMRINFSHATVEEFHLRRTNLRASKGGDFVPVMLDTKGPEMRMGGLAVCKAGGRKAKITLEAGNHVTLTTDPAFDGNSDEKTLYVGYALLADKVSPGTTVLLDDGLVSLRVVAVQPNRDVRCQILNTSAIGERKGVNLPGIVTDLPPLSDKDKEDIRFGIEHDIDAVAASFVRNAEGVRAIRAHIAECHARYAPDPASPPPLIISKIESTEALVNLEEIIAESDGLMVARGDLGVEVPIEEVVTWQKIMVRVKGTSSVAESDWAN